MTLDDRIAEIANKAMPGDAKSVVNSIAARVAKGTGIPFIAIMGHTHAQPAAQARHLVMYEARQRGLTYSAIGWAMNRDHTSVMHGVRREAARRGVKP